VTSILPVICGWILQKKSYVPGWLNVMPAEAFVASGGVVHVSSDLTVAVCCTESEFVHVITSPTFAETVAGSNAKFAILTDTVPVASDGAHAPAAADAGASLAGAEAGASLAGASLAGAWLAGAAVGALVAAVPLQAATRSIVTTRVGRVRVRVIAGSSTLRARSFLGYVDVYVPGVRLVS
jgi:hypothetical protein